MQVYVTRGSGVEALGEIYRASVYGINPHPQRRQRSLFSVCVCVCV